MFKSAAAAAKTTATKDAPVVSAKSAGEGAKVLPQKSVAKKADAPKASGGGARIKTDDKLGMSLEDMIKTEGTRRKGSEKKAGGEKKEGGGSKKKAEKAGQGRLKLRRERGKAQAKAKASAKAGKSGGAAKAWGGKSDDRFGGHDDRWGPAPGKGGGKGDFDDWGGPRKRKAAAFDDWGPPPARAAPEKWMRMADTRSSWGRGAADRDWGMDRRGDDRWGDDWGGSRSSTAGARISSALGYGGRSAAWDRVPQGRRDDSWGAPAPREFTTRSRMSAGMGGASLGARAPVERVTRSERAAPAGARIKVTNVPNNLDRRDIKDAFEDIGTVTHCEVDRGVAEIIFARAADAKKAVQTFDRGELNGQTIYVSAD